MAMSQGELIWKRQQESKRFLSRQQTKDCSLQTYINQAKASKVIFTPTPDKRAIVGSTTVGPVEKGINNNTYQPTPVQACCATTVANDIYNINQQNRVAMKNAGAVICCEPDYSLFNGYSIDLSGDLVKGGVTCPLPNLVNNAKVPNYITCSSCLKFYFPNPAQPALCSNCGTQYPNNRFYPPQPIDPQLRRYGDDRVPQQDRGGCPLNTPTMGDLTLISDTGVQPIVIGYTFTGENLLVSGTVTGDSLVSYDVAFPLTPGTITFNVICVNETSDVTIEVTIQNDCGSVTKTLTIQVIPVCIS